MSISFFILLVLPWLNFLNGLVFRKNAQISSIFLSAILVVFGSSFLFQEENFQEIHSFPWFQIGNLNFDLSFTNNEISRGMGLLVPLVGLIVQIYSFGYLKNDPNRSDFFIYLNGFIGSMLLLSLSNNLLIFYISWELVGLFSYLLIGFWKENPAANRAATKAFLINRVADFCLLSGVILTIHHFGVVEFSKMNPTLNGALPNFTALLLILGAAGKSAQFPFSSWLPDAMEGPTPASALIHAATMVTAGVILGIKIMPLIHLEMQWLFGGIGLISFIGGAIMALFQADLKKILAYSTISQIGFMWLGLGTSSSLFHLLTHGVFKAGLFLAAGIIIHENENRKIKNPKNIYEMPRLIRDMPIAMTTFLIFGLNLIGIPGTIAFFSKENILNQLVLHAEGDFLKIPFSFLFYGAIIGLLISSLYTARLIYLIGFNRNPLKRNKEEIKPLLYSPIIFLAAISFFWIISYNPFEINFDHFKTWFNIAEIKTNYPILTINSIIWLISLGLIFILRKWQPQPFRLGGDQFWKNLFYLSLIIADNLKKIIEKRIDNLVILIGKISVVVGHLIHWLDNHLIDFLLVKLSGKITQFFGNFFSKIQKGNYRSYVLSAFISIILLILIIRIKSL